MRDHRKLEAIQLADQLVMAVYKLAASLPPDERYRLTSQIRRAAVSIPSNIVEGRAKHTTADYVRFLDNAYGSVCELEYQLSLVDRVRYVIPEESKTTRKLCSRVARILNCLIRSLRAGP